MLFLCRKQKRNISVASLSRQSSDVHCSVKASALKEIHRLNSKRLPRAFVCELHCDVLFRA